MWNQTLPTIKTLSKNEVRNHPALKREDFHQSRVTEWCDFYAAYNSFPPVQIIEDGILIDGHHRFAASRLLGVSLWCVIVYSENGKWCTNGKVCLIK